MTSAERKFISSQASIQGQVQPTSAGKTTIESVGVGALLLVMVLFLAFMHLRERKLDDSELEVPDVVAHGQSFDD